MDFNELPIDNKLKNSIKFADFKTPTPIQSKSIPISLMGKDILGTAQTGTGKTLAFTIPMINKIILDKNAMALIICPTRELASQVMQTVLKLNVREIGIGNASPRRQTPAAGPNPSGASSDRTASHCPSGPEAGPARACPTPTLHCP